MNVILLTKEGKAPVEKTSRISKLYETPGEYHPITNDSIWRDANRKMPPMMILIEGVLGPYGASMTKEDVLTILYEAELAERAFKPVLVNKMWHRMLERIWAWITTYGVGAAIAIFVIGSVVYSILGGQ